MPTTTIISPPSYPMRPWQLTKDFFVADETSPTGLRRNVPTQLGNWWFEPVYARGTVFLLSTKTGDTFTRTLNPIRWSGKEKTTLAQIAQKFPGDHWLHCVMLNHVDPENAQSTAVGVIDYLDFKETFDERRAILEKAFEQLGIRLPIQDRFYFLVPKFSSDVLPNLWHALRAKNKEAGRPVFTGFIGKRADSTYEKQLEDYKNTNPEWHLHLFADMGVTHAA